MSLLESSLEFYSASNWHYCEVHKGLGVTDEFFALYCMGGEL